MDRILIISPFEVFPPYWGAANRVYNVSRCLATDYGITLLSVSRRQVATSTAGDDPLTGSSNFRVSRIKSFGRYSQVFNPLLLIAGFFLSRRERYSFIIAETGWAGLHALLLSFLTGIPYILDEHNVEWVAFERMKRGGRPGVFLLKCYERLICRFAHRILCVSDVDRDILLSELNVKEEKIVVVPNGIDTERFRLDASKRAEIRRFLGLTESTPLVLFNGKLDYRPNRDAVAIICRDIMPRVLAEEPDARFIVIGHNPPLEFSHRNLLFTGTVDRIEDYINASDVVICPLRSGGGTRFKILEAVACGKRVISTAIGAEAIVGRETESHLTCVDDWEQFACEIINAVHSDSDTAPDESFARKYSWAQVSHILKSQVLS